MKNNLFSNFDNPIIIYGEKGIGKSSFIKNLIVDLFKNSSKGKNILLKTKHSKLILSNSHPNLNIITKLLDDKTKKIKNNITIDQIRNLESFIYKSAILDLPKIILINSADDLNINASNALLKILEEPKKNTFFILISHQPSRLIPTIRSRCIKFQYKQPTFDEFKQMLLLKKINLDDKEKISYLFDLSNGNPGIASEIHSQESSNFFEIFLNLCKEKSIITNNIINFSSKLSTLNNEQFIIFLIIVKFILLNILKINIGINIKNIFVSNISSKLYEISEYINKTSCIKALDYLNEYENKLLVFHLDKKIFTINLFSVIAKN